MKDEKGSKGPFRKVHKDQLVRLAWGRWKANLEALALSLNTFSDLQVRVPYGEHDFCFVILDNPLPSIPLSRSWMIGAHAYDRESLMTWEFAPGKFAAKDGEPYAEILAREASGFVKVEFWHNGRHPTGLLPYLSVLWQALIEDGLESEFIDELNSQGFLGWITGTPPFAENEKLSETVPSEIVNEDATQKIAGFSKLTDEEKLSKIIDPQILNKLDQMQSEAQVEHITFTTSPVINTDLKPLVMIATWLTEYAMKTAERIQNQYYVPSISVNADGQLKHEPVEPVPVPYKIIEADERLVVFSFGGKFYRCNSEGEGRIIMLPDGRLSVTLKGQKSDWPNLMWNVKHLMKGLYESGWIEEFPSEWGESSELTPESNEASQDETAVSDRARESDKRVVICQKGDKNQLEQLFNEHFSEHKPLNGFFIKAKKGGGPGIPQRVNGLNIIIMPSIGWSIYYIEKKEVVGSIKTFQIPKGMRVTFDINGADEKTKIHLLIDAIIERMNDWGFEPTEEQVKSALSTNPETVAAERGSFSTLPGDAGEEVDFLRSNTDQLANRLQQTQEPLGIRAKRLGIRSFRLERWDKIKNLRETLGLSQQNIADRLSLELDTVKRDCRDMRKKGYWKWS